MATLCKRGSQNVIIKTYNKYSGADDEMLDKKDLRNIDSFFRILVKKGHSFSQKKLIKFLFYRLNAKHNYSLAF